MEATPGGGGGTDAGGPKGVPAGGNGSGGDPDLKVMGLDLIAQGINKSLGELDSLGGMKGWTGGAGRGFTDLEMDGLDIGDDQLGAALHTFCERWQWGVRKLVHEGNAFAEAVGLAAGIHYETDQYVKGSMKVLYNSGVGDPYADNNTVAKESMDDINHAATSTDYSRKSFDDMLGSARHTGTGMVRDVATSDGMPGMPVSASQLRHLAGVSDTEYEADMSRTLGIDLGEDGGGD